MKKEFEKAVFSNINEYLKGLAEDPGISILTVSMAAEALSVSRSSVERNIDLGRLRSVQIGDDRFVAAASVSDMLRTYRDRISAVKSKILEYLAKGEPCFYQTIMDPIGLSTNIPAHRGEIGKILRTISEESLQERGCLISVIVHRKSGKNSMPSNSFFELAEELGFNVSDKEKFVEHQTALALKRQ